MGVYNNNKDGTRSTLANTIQVVDAPMEQFISRGEFNAVTPNDVGTQNKLVTENEVTKTVSTMPTASADLVGTIVQYVGTTTASYTNGYFYKCISDGAVTPTYSWVEVISGGGGGSSTLANLTDVELTNLLDNDILKYDNTTHKWMNDTPEEGSLVSAVISKDTMPTASVDYNRIAILFTGTTTSNYTQGHIYLCTEVSGSYTWVELTQGGGTSSVDAWSQRVEPIVFEPQESGYTYHDTQAKLSDELLGEWTLKPNDIEIFQMQVPRNNGKLTTNGAKIGFREINDTTWVSRNLNNDLVPSSPSAPYLTSYLILINNRPSKEYFLKLKMVGNSSGYPTNDTFFYFKRCNLSTADKGVLADRIIADTSLLSQVMTLNP